MDKWVCEISEAMNVIDTILRDIIEDEGDLTAALSMIENELDNIGHGCYGSDFD